MEKWKRLIKYPDYSVSTLGRVRRDSAAKGTYPGRVKVMIPDATNYLVISLSRKGKCCWAHVHRLVTETYLGKVPKNKQINHKDGNKHNNALSNLEIVTRSQNMRHIFEIGKHDLAYVTPQDVRKIRAYKNKSRKQLAKMYNVSESAIHNIIVFNTWKGV